jgi:hypothetical protein
MRTTKTQGMPNFLPFLWEMSQKTPNDYPDPPSHWTVWYIPYSKMPGYEVGVIGQLCPAFNTIDQRKLSDILNNLWKLPADYRLNFDFQSHRLRTKSGTIESP